MIGNSNYVSQNQQHDRKPLEYAIPATAAAFSVFWNEGTKDEIKQVARKFSVSVDNICIICIAYMHIYVLVHSQSYISPRKPKYPKTFYKTIFFFPNSLIQGVGW